MYRVASSSEYLAITGFGIDDIKIAKKAWILPFQTYAKFDISPVNYSFEVQAISSEKRPFVVPGFFTIGPHIEHKASLRKYAKLICPHDNQSQHVNELVKGVIEGETRVMAASLTVDEIFKCTKQFKKEVLDKVQLELNQFGLLIYNANVKQLIDIGHENFSYLGQKTDQMKGKLIDIGHENFSYLGQKTEMKGENIGSKQREGKLYRVLAKVAEVEAKKSVALRDAELEREVEPGPVLRFRGPKARFMN